MRTTANVEVIGFLSGDAQLTYSTDGEALLRFSIPNNIKHGNGDEETNWYHCRISGKRAEALQPYLVKSTALFVRGPAGSSRVGGQRRPAAHEPGRQGDGTGVPG